jgi:hypothetical protein
VSEFVEECRREWKRLGVPDAAANEMAADLEADLEEAAGEGASAEEVLGSGAFDPRSFAAAWAAERGLVPPPRPTENGAPRRSRPPAVAAVFALVAIIGLVLLAVFAVHAAPEKRVAVAVKRPGLGIVVPPGLRVVPAPGGAGPRFGVVPAQGVRVVAAGASRSGLVPVGLLLLLVGFVGLVATLLYWWSPWARRRARAG